MVGARFGYSAGCGGQPWPLVPRCVVTRLWSLGSQWGVVKEAKLTKATQALRTGDVGVLDYVDNWPVRPYQVDVRHSRLAST